MKKLHVISVVAAMSSFFLACSKPFPPASQKIGQRRLQLVSPDGVRIANSIEELKSRIESSGIGWDDNRGENPRMLEPITITKITYGQEKGSPPLPPTMGQKVKVTLANVHYKTSTGKKAVYWLSIFQPY
ncbi:hypothetical protein [Larkinella soli]|uniref:hypothetical protein n=1 Tax=Larkinella soli TaxID=1770527 RepID=UPI000FFBA218|nr:hypothetical protein [Larkinella soli]